MSLEAFLRESIYQYTIAANGESNLRALFSTTPSLIGDFERLLDRGTVNLDSTVDISCLLDKASSGPVLETLLKVLFGEQGYQAQINLNKPPYKAIPFEQDKFNALWLQNQANAVASRLNRLRESNNQVALADLIPILMIPAKMPNLKATPIFPGLFDPDLSAFGPPALEYIYQYQLSDYPSHEPTETEYDSLTQRVCMFLLAANTDVQKRKSQMRMIHADMLEMGSFDGMCALAKVYSRLSQVRLISDFPKVYGAQQDSGPDLRERFKAVIRDGKLRAKDTNVIFKANALGFVMPPFNRSSAPLYEDNKRRFHQLVRAAEEGYLQNFVSAVWRAYQMNPHPRIDVDAYFEMARQGNAHQYHELVVLITDRDFPIDINSFLEKHDADKSINLDAGGQRKLAIQEILGSIEHTARMLNTTGFLSLREQIGVHCKRNNRLSQSDLSEFIRDAYSAHATATTEESNQSETQSAPTTTQTQLIPDTLSYKQQMQSAIKKCKFLSDEQSEYLLEKAKIADTPPQFPHVIRVSTSNKLEVEKVKKLLEILTNNDSVDEKKKALHTAASINTGLWSEHQGIGKFFTTGSAKFPAP